MYFRDKFDKQIQTLARKQPKGASTYLGSKLKKKIFYREKSGNGNDVNETALVIPLIMYDYIKCTDSTAKILDIQNQEKDTVTAEGYKGRKQLCVICKDSPTTRIIAGEYDDS